MPVCADSMFILADDLSGAADCAVGGAQAGLKSVVLLEHSVPPGPADLQSRVAPLDAAEVIAVDSDSRHRTAEASRALNLALWRAHSAPGRLFYKKIDSTLRGNFASDSAALCEAGVAIVAPAFPRAGRTTKHGRVFVKGVPLEQTEIWASERGRGGADVVAMLRAAGVAAVNLPLPAVRGDVGPGLARLVSEPGVHAVVCDAEEDDDLAAIAAASISLPVYWVGSAGLLPHVLHAAGLRGRSSRPTLEITGSIVTVVGSLSTVSRGQADALQSGATLAVFTATADALRLGEDHPLWRALREGVGEALSARADVLIRTGVEGQAAVIGERVVCQAVGRLLGPMAARVGALIATGGDTARALLSEFRASGLQLVREVEPGIPLSIALGPRSFPVITKAGAFGASEALLRCYRELDAIRCAGGAGVPPASSTQAGPHPSGAVKGQD